MPTKMERDLDELEEKKHAVKDITNKKEAEEIRKKFPTFKTRREGGKPYNKGIMHFHRWSDWFHVEGFSGFFWEEIPNYYICVKCGEVVREYPANSLVHTWGTDGTVGYVDPNEETLKVA